MDSLFSSELSLRKDYKRKQMASKLLVTMHLLSAHFFKYVIPLNLLNNSQFSDGKTS